MQFLSNFIADSRKIYRLWNSNKFFHQLLKVLYNFITLNAIGTYVFNCKLFRFAVQRNEIYCSFLHYRLSANFMSFGKTIGMWKKDLRLLILLYPPAGEGRSYAEVRTNEQARSDASNACPLHLLCKCEVPARGGVRFSNTLPSSPIWTDQSRGYA